MIQGWKRVTRLFTDGVHDVMTVVANVKASAGSSLVSSTTSVALFFTQIIWLGVGTTLFSDTAEKIFHCPHFLVVALASALMIASLWFGIKAIFSLSILVLAAVIYGIYFSSFAAAKHSVLVLWADMINAHSFDYVNGLLMMMGSFASWAACGPGASVDHKSNDGVIGMLFLVGNALMMGAGTSAALMSGATNLTAVLAQQMSYVLALSLLGWSMKSFARDNPVVYHQLFHLHLSKCKGRLAVLLLGALCAILADWIYHWMDWLYYLSVFLPSLGLLLFNKRCFKHPLALGVLIDR